MRQALKSERRTSQDEAGSVAFNFDITPYYYQQEILDKLKAEREVHHSFKNLVVAATGTGKTVIAAFDYRDFCRANPGRPNKLLFVAHRKEILSQSLVCFRGILKDLNFGSMMVGGLKPDSFDHLFVSIQSFNSKELTEITTPDFYDYIVIDEFHYAAALSYQELLDYYRPKILLGLTATPERADGRSIYSYFEGRIAAKIRLWEAIERKLLSPFHYFGVTDNVDFSQVRWVAGKYDEREIENLFVFERAVAVKRVGNVIKAIERYCLERSDIIGIGFCHTKKHAEFKGELNVREFFEGYHVTPQDVYSKKVTVVGLAAQAGLLKEYRANQERERLLASAIFGRNDEPPVIMDVIRFYTEEQEQRSGLPAFIVFISDGGVNKNREIKRMITDAARLPLFWQFVGIGREKNL